MKISFLELTNFRSMKSERISFEGKNFVVLIGDNGSGKTTILEAITKAFVPILRAVIDLDMEMIRTNDQTH